MSAESKEPKEQGTKAQLEFIEAVLVSAAKCDKLADKAFQEGLPILSDFLRETVRIIRAGVERQKKALSSGSGAGY